MLTATPVPSHAAPFPGHEATAPGRLTTARAPDATCSQGHASDRGGLAQADALPDTIETRLWLEEHQWLHSLLRDAANVSPTFRMPDLVSACVSLVFLHDNAATRIFGFLGSVLVLRPPLTPRRRESLWRAQYELLLAVQRSPANRHPNPKFQLDQLTTACVALCQARPDAASLVLRQSRLNMAERALRARQRPAV